MAENKADMNNKKPKFKERKDVSLQDKKEQKMKSKIHKKKIKQMMRKRLIVRNLSFKVSENELKNIFSAFGEVLDVNIPLKPDGRKRGFAFVRYKEGQSLIRAMKALNFKEIKGRPVAIDYAVDKTTYQSNKNGIQPTPKETKKDELNSDSDSESEDEDKTSSVSEQEKKIDSDEASDDEDVKVKQFLKQFNADEEPVENSDSSENDNSSDDSDGEDNESEMSEQEEKTPKHKPQKKQSADVSEGKTVFIRNVSYNTMDEDLKEIMGEYGETVYCLLCVDPVTDHPKGTAFVKFKEKESADKLVKESGKEPGVLLDGRKLICDYALSREELSNRNDPSQKVKDKRNLRLLKCGLILRDSEEAAGVSQTDMSKRAQLEMVKKSKLKNVNFFVSDRRLAIHNLPKNLTDKDLRFMFKKAAGKEAVITEARVMKDFKKTDSQGIPVSRGYGFVSFTEHEHALKALEELNNNPHIFTASKRPIVEFSIENKVALLSQERKKEKLKQIHKRKLEEKQMSNNQDESQPSCYNFKMPEKNKKRDNRPPRSKKRKLSSFPEQLSHEIKKQTSKKTKKKNQKTKKGKTMNSREKTSLSMLTNKYKEKLLNKIS